MTEHEYISHMQSALASGQEIDSSTLALSEQAVRAHPNSAQLWYLRGTLILAGAEDTAYAGALLCFEQAIRLSPDFAEAHQAIGDYYDGWKDEPAKAMKHYARVAKLTGRTLD